MNADDRSDTQASDAEIAAVWRANRSYLVNVAYGILRDIGGAEDAVQEAFVRLTAADFASIEDVRGWLVVVTSRICLDQINSARMRRERSHETETLERVAGASTGPDDPADRVTLDDEVRTALAVMLDRLSPAERVVFVLHDVFQTPFDSIAETVGRPVATCRQLARRARLKIADEHRVRPRVDVAVQRAIADSFIQACAVGDIAGLVAVLDPEVWGDADLGPLDPRTGVVNHGSPIVSTNLMRWFTPDITIVQNPLSDECELLAFLDGEPYAVISLYLDGDSVSRIHVAVSPEQVAALPRQRRVTAREL